MKRGFRGKAAGRIVWDDQKKFEVLFLVLIGIFLFAWAVVQPLIFSPDEKMRYKVVEYIFRHNALPHGGDPEVLDASWGISYAFYPVLSYLVSYVYMKLVSIFTMDSYAILVAARMAEVTFGLGTAYYTMKIGKHFFKGAYEKMFLFLVTFLPGAFVLFTYVNCDALALVSTAMLIYSWLRGLEDQWSRRSCVRTAVGVSMCALSYYNAYGVVLATVVVFILSILFAEGKKWNFKKLFARGLFITGIVVVLAGWWFARSYVLYDGDILGLNITTEYAEKYAEEERKPSNRYTFQENPNVNVIDMMFYRAEWNRHNWMMMVYYSFIGSFGYMNVWLPERIGKLFMLFFFGGLIGLAPQLKDLFALRKSRFSEQKQICDTTVKVRYTYGLSRMSRQGIFHLGMLITLVVPNLLNIYNSYVNDYQPQGRYSMPMLIPLMYFMTVGYRWLFVRLDKRGRAAKVFCYGICFLMVVLLLYSYFGLFYPACMEKWSAIGK